MIKLTAIVPRRLLDGAAIERDALKELDALADDLVRAMSVYPPAQPWKNPPKSGLRKGGKRTGNLGRGWRKVQAGPSSRDVINLVRYAVWVQGPNDKGPGQTRVMRVRGWQSITDTGRDLARKHRPALIRAVLGQRR